MWIFDPQTHKGTSGGLTRRVIRKRVISLGTEATHQVRYH